MTFADVLNSILLYWIALIFVVIHAGVTDSLIGYTCVGRRGVDQAGPKIQFPQNTFYKIKSFL